MAEDARSYLGLRLKGRYLIEDHIGTGLSAHAFRAYDALLQGRVVVKIIKSEIAGVPIDLGEEWKEESRKAMQVRGHPHIASILDLGEEAMEIGGEPEVIHFIVTEFIEGKTLRDLAADGGALEPQALLAIAHQLLSTLDFLQARKLSHDDLHAGNIMVSHLGAERPFIKIIDFGMASNTLIPRSREKDIHFALNQLDYLCQKSLASATDTQLRSILEGFAASLKKAQNFIPSGRMRIADLVAETESLQQGVGKSAHSAVGDGPVEDGQRRRIDVIRRTPFVGRRNEIERLYRTITAAFLSKRGAMLFVSGEAGIGKTRLVDEALRRLASERTRHLLLCTRCQQAPNLPFTSLFQAIVDFLNEIPGKNDEERLMVVLGSEHSLVKPLADLMAEYRAFSQGSSSETREGSAFSNTAHLLIGFLTQSALNTPVVLFLDDLHWADETTVAFLEMLAPRMQDTPIVIIATHRPEELALDLQAGLHPLLTLLTKLDATKSCRIVELGGLNREDVDEILSNLHTFVKPEDFSNLSDCVRQMAGGNPFYLFEITALMRDEGLLVERGENQWIIKGDLTDFKVPPSINSLIQRRVDRLSLDEILLLRTASLQGDSFELNIVSRMFTPSDQSPADIIRSLIRHHGLIQDRGGGRYAFSHHQVRRAILRSMSPDAVARGHRDVARLLEQHAAENKISAPHHLIAHHLALSGDFKAAAEHFHSAGKRALDAQQFHLALDHLRHAADLLNPPDAGDGLVTEVLLDLLEAVKPLGERRLHERAVQQLKAVAQNSRDPDLELRAMLEECVYLRMISDNEKSLQVARELIELGRAGEDGAIEAAALKEAGTTSYLMGNMQVAEEHFHQAAGILASTGDRKQLARVYNNLGLVCRNTNRQGEMIRYFQRALDIFRELGDGIGQRFPLGNLGLVYFERGEYERAFECFTALKASLGDRVDLMMEAKVDFSIGEIFLEVGLIDKARSACERALETFLTIGNRQGESEVLGTLGGIHLARGDIQIAKEYFTRSIEVKKAIGNMLGMLHSRITLARIANLEGRHDEALKIAGEVLESARRRKLRSIELECLTEIMVARSQIENPSGALAVLGSEEEPSELGDQASPALVTFAYKAGELSFQAGDESRALKYIALSGKIVENILEGISEPEWREAYQKKRHRILETYRRLKPAIANL